MCPAASASRSLPPFQAGSSGQGEVGAARGGSRVCLGLRAEGVSAAPALCGSSGIKLIGFCFPAGSDRGFVRDSVFSCLE